ncbi:MAG: hypothetical protein COA90_06550 [Gammaproteobacteria bacterium]|nr:MAG: hypothetical protein COA90_06550 [Gammaproteobacteria bacterium]
MPPKAKAKPKQAEPEREKEQPKEEMAPPTVKAPPAPQVAAPRDAAVSLAPSPAPANWRSAVLGHLEHHKRYPRKARRRKQQAVVYARVVISRTGAVLSYSLDRPSKYKALNKETLALIKRADPLPAPPPEIEGETIEFVVPVAFTIK